MKGGLDGEIEKLYQLPLEDFTAARNALAKGAGKRAAEVRGLTKPPVTAWAVNQLYWKRRHVYDALIDAAQDARNAHAAILAGKSGDVRSTGKGHDERVAEALDATLEVLREAGHPATDASRQAIITTLRALPGDEPAGMLTKPLQPGGFEALAGLSIRGAKAPIAFKPPPKPAPKPEKHDRDGKTRDAKAIAKAREAVAAATKALKNAQHTAQREEFERARAVREAERAEKAVAIARRALEEAETEMRDAEDAAAAAKKHKDAAEERSDAADRAVEAAQAALDKAQAQLDAEL
jgi:hypothetical protein